MWPRAVDCSVTLLTGLKVSHSKDDENGQECFSSTLTTALTPRHGRQSPVCNMVTSNLCCSYSCLPSSCPPVFGPPQQIRRTSADRWRITVLFFLTSQSPSPLCALLCCAGPREDRMETRRVCQTSFSKDCRPVTANDCMEVRIIIVFPLSSKLNFWW